jgi:hypothetical protein
MNTETKKLLEAVGFVFERTGGNCEAYVKRNDASSCWYLTNGDGGLPENLSSPATLSLIPDAHSEPEKEFEFNSIPDLLEAFSNEFSKVWA